MIHRHGLSEAAAFEVEGALINAYPGLANKADGIGNGERGCRHVDEIARIYAATLLVALEDLILIFVGKTLDQGRDVYSAVRCAWYMSLPRAEKHKLVLAYDGGVVVGAYRPTKWLPATKANFPELSRNIDDRIGFVGHPAKDVWDHYAGTRPPPRPKGARSSFTYIAKMP